jgi:transketolase
MNTAPLDEKFEAFGCKVVKINGHDFDDIEKALRSSTRTTARASPL